MNVYCLVEGRVTEKQVYSSWIPLVNPKLSVVQFLQQVQSNNVFIISGEGLPQLFSRIAASARDIAQFPVFDRFVISLDSEEMDPQAKLNELMTLLPGPSKQLDEAIAIDTLLREIEGTHAEWCSIIDLKFFLGFTDEEAAEALGMSLRSLQRQYGDARRWLFERLQSK